MMSQQAEIREGIRNLITVYNEYIELLGKEIDELTGIAYAHGWRESSRQEEGIKGREKILSTQNSLLDLIECDMVKEFDFNFFKNGLMEHINSANSIELSIYMEYPSTIKYPILEQDNNIRTFEHDWLQSFGDKIISRVEDYNGLVDNKIVVGFKPIYNNVSVQTSTLFLSYKDGLYKIGVECFNGDGKPPITIKKFSL
jgi:hypothetical protein